MAVKEAEEEMLARKVRSASSLLGHACARTFVCSGEASSLSFSRTVCTAPHLAHGAWGACLHMHARFCSIVCAIPTQCWCTALVLQGGVTDEEATKKKKKKEKVE